MSYGIYVHQIIEHLKMNHGSFDPVCTSERKTATFVVAAMPLTIRSGEASLVKEFVSEYYHYHGTQEEDTLTWHDVKIEALSSEPRLPLSRVTVDYSIGFSDRRKRICGFLEELNALQTKYGISVTEGPMLQVFVSKCAAPYMLMTDDGSGNVMFSRPWGG